MRMLEQTSAILLSIQILTSSSTIQSGNISKTSDADSDVVYLQEEKMPQVKSEGISSKNDNIEIIFKPEENFNGSPGDPLKIYIDSHGFIRLKGSIKVASKNFDDSNTVIAAKMLQPRFSAGNKNPYQISSFSISYKDSIDFGSISCKNSSPPIISNRCQVTLKKQDDSYYIVLEGKELDKLEIGTELSFDSKAYSEYLDNRAVSKQIHSKLPQIEKGNFNFIFTTDIHNIPIDSRVKEGVKLLNLVKSIIDMPVVSTGDLSDQLCSVMTGVGKIEHINGIKKFKELIGENFLWCKGNHDDNSLQDKNMNSIVTEEELRELLLKDMKAPGLKITISKNGLYYYADDIEKKVRLVFLNTHENDRRVVNNYIKENTGPVGYVNQEQLDFLANEALDFSGKGEDKVNWHTCFFSHYPFNFQGTKSYGGERCINGDHMWGIIRAFKNGTNVDIPSVYRGDTTHSLKGLTKNFTTQGPMTVAGCFYGHYHNDQLQVKDGITLVSSEPFTSRNANIDWFQGPRNIYSCDEFSFDIVTIDKTARRVTLKRIGSHKSEDRIYNY